MDASTSPATLLPGGTWTLGDRTVSRFGYGAMQLAGPGVMGPPSDHAGAMAVLREAADQGITHIDTSDAYGPHITNQLIREALYPYPETLFIATKVGAERDAQGGWPTKRQPSDLREQVHENLRTLGVERLDLVNLRMGDAGSPRPGSLAEPLHALMELQQEGLIGELGLSNVTDAQVAEAQGIARIVCVQNMYNVAYRQDDALVSRLAEERIAYVPFFPLGGFTPLQSATLSRVSAAAGASPLSVALAWLLERSPNILLIPGTSSAAHLRENIAGAGLVLSAEDVRELDSIGG
ncbi:oxidoreductase [Arthrobacter sp. zg-Y1143]|uniref:oxidoreductase n=1 Tax=Arthrobacter sp. zg-Y1143 TaxID=3049065 RepID=UPI0024C286AD|nr:oxidoreductase [Arthrobacter sp. zg-Y1143]MDK1329145.1 oxidoreductase [Arthrobacter sp. zg-Y1143]